MRARPILPVLLALAVALVATPGRPAAAGTRLAEREAAAGGPRVASRHAILVDARDGAVLWGRGSRTPRPPASLTKMLTALTVRASLDLDGQVAASRLAARQAGATAGRQARPAAHGRAGAEGAHDRVGQRRGGDAGRGRRRVGGPLRAGDGRRVAPARVAPFPLAQPARLDAPGHRSSAFDLAILARAVLRDTWLARVVRMRRAAFTSPSGRRHTLTARSRFLLGYRGAVGVKTGLTDDAGHCLAAAATRGGRRLIAVVLDSPDTAADAAAMLDWGFAGGHPARTGLRLPGHVAPAGVTALLVRPPRMLERHRPVGPGAVTATGGVPAAGGTPDTAARTPARERWWAGARAATGAGATAALLAAGLVLRRRRRASVP